MSQAPPVILASASPRRRALLEQIGIRCTVAPANIEEIRAEHESPEAYTRRLAQEKAAACRHQYEDGIIIAADTVISLGETIMEKPSDKQQGVAMLRALSGKTHQVITSFALRYGAKGWLESCITRVQMAALSDAQCEAYWQSQEPQGKAGGYAIQGLGALLIERIEGSYSNVVGLPLYELGRALKAVGYPLPVASNDTGSA